MISNLGLRLIRRTLFVMELCTNIIKTHQKCKMINQSLAIRLFNESENQLSIPNQVAVIGGGRWGKITCNILSQFQPQISKIYLVSQRNFKNSLDWCNHQSPNTNKALTNQEQVIVSNNFDELLHNPNVEVAFVTNLPAEHYETTKQLLTHGKHVLVEKPFVLDPKQGKELVDLANEKNLVLAVGLEYLLASYVHHFRWIIEQNFADIDYIEIFWHDVLAEQRWGSLKQPDLTVNVVTDIYPHILSLLYVLFEYQEINLKNVDLQDGGLSANLTFFYGSLPIKLSLSRTTNKPLRAIKIVSPKGEKLVMDFTQEPGTITLNGEILPKDSAWDNCPKPLPAEISYFFRKIQHRCSSIPFLAKDFLYIVQAGKEANTMIIQKQTELIREHLIQDYSSDLPLNVLVALREHLIVPMLNNQLIDSPKDEESINYWTTVAFHLIYKLSSQPFITQKDILNDINLDKEKLIKLNSVLRESDFVQELICKNGAGSKYWQNTIIPLIQSGAIEAARKNTYRHPFRVGIYPGVACMFYCTFCGRNYSAKYERDVIPTGNDGFKEMFRQAPKDDPYTFYISGGLEPLTNPGIGDLVRYGAEQGFKLSMYTNGFLLTPHLLQKQEGLWDLDTLRISFYGIDPETTATVTRNKHSFEQVLKNAKEFLKLRNARQSPLKFGFNFVILPGRAEQILQLAEILAEINRDAGGDRQIDFLTLREDYSRNEDEAISPKERAHLIDIFAQLAERRKKDDLCNLYIDFGYAINAMNEGTICKPLEMVNHSDMRKKGYPQISVVADLLGDVYLYREAGFLKRPGADRYIIGRVSKSKSLEMVVRDFIESGCELEPMPEDTMFFDIFDHIVTKLLNQTDDDSAFGIPFNKGPIRGRVYPSAALHTNDKLTVAHPTLAHPTLVELTQGRI